jgi:hypothetical protein
MKKDLIGSKKVQKPKKRSNRENASSTPVLQNISKKKPNFRKQQDSSLRLT